MDEHVIEQADFEVFYRAFRPRVHRLAVRLVGSDAAEDVAQEVMIQALRWSDTAGRGRPPWPWLAVATRHVAVDHVRRLRRTVPAPAEVLEDLCGHTDDGPAVAAVRSDVRAHLDRAMDRLPQSDRWLLARHDVFGDPTSTIAARLGVSAAALRQRLCRARRELARYYREVGGQQLAVHPGVVLVRARRRTTSWLSDATASIAHRDGIMELLLPISLAGLLTAAASLSPSGALATPSTEGVPAERSPAQSTLEGAAWQRAERRVTGVISGVVRLAKEVIGPAAESWDDPAPYVLEAEDGTVGSACPDGRTTRRTTDAEGVTSVVFPTHGCRETFPGTGNVAGVLVIVARVEAPLRSTGAGCGRFVISRGAEVIGHSATFCESGSSYFQSLRVVQSYVAPVDPAAPLGLEWQALGGALLRARVDHLVVVRSSGAHAITTGDTALVCARGGCVQTPRVRYVDDRLYEAPASDARRSHQPIAVPTLAAGS